VSAGRRDAVGLASRHAGEAVDYLGGLGLLERGATGRRPLTVRGYARLLRETLDAQATRAGASHWLEKTPDHVRFIDPIERHFPGARILHMIRSGQAVVASLYEAKRDHPDVWGHLRPAGTLAAVWRADLHRSHACIGRPNHAFVSYERLVADPPAVLRRVCAFLELPLDDALLSRMLSDYSASGRQVAWHLHATTSGLVRKPEPWKDNLDRRVENHNSKKFQRVLTTEERVEVNRIVAPERPVFDSIPFL
jgi:hypothetical protein